MTQPKFSPILLQDEVREVSKLPPPAPWTMHRPADFNAEPAVGRRPGRGSAGPDQGYAMLLAESLADTVALAAHEHLEDVLHGASVIAMRRAASFGRAPVKRDLELALRLFGYLGDGPVPPTVVEERQKVFSGVAHDYWRERELADLVPESTLRMTPSAVADRLQEDPGAAMELSGLDRVVPGTTAESPDVAGATKDVAGVTKESE